MMHRLLCALLLSVPLFAAEEVPNRTISTTGEALILGSLVSLEMICALL